MYGDSVDGGAGSDFIITGEDASEAIGGQGNDFILGGKANEQDMGNEGDDWLELGLQDGAAGESRDQGRGALRREGRGARDPAD